MITVNNDTKEITISIPCGNEDPFEKLQNIQNGVLNAMANIDFAETPNLQIQNSISVLCELLKNMQLRSPDQLGKIAA